VPMHTNLLLLHDWENHLLPLVSSFENHLESVFSDRKSKLDCFLQIFILQLLYFL
jgi:hypothetical protein